MGGRLCCTYCKPEGASPALLTLLGMGVGTGEGVTNEPGGAGGGVIVRVVTLHSSPSCPLWADSPTAETLFRSILKLVLCRVSLWSSLFLELYW